MSCISRAVLLAGGGGTRLLPLTRRICGDERPKQFCPLIGGRTLLAQTRSRIQPLFQAADTFYAVVEAQRRFYEVELADVAPSRIFLQPENRGTSAAIAYSLLRIARTDPNEIVAVFPTDHYFADETEFRAAVELAGETIRQHPEFLVLLGATPESAGSDYGWVELGSSLGNASTSCVFRASSFWEKPSPNIARELHRNGCLLNTFVMCARAGVFLELLRLAAPDLMRAFAPLSVPSSRETKTLGRIYRILPTGDFSRQVLAACTNRLLVVRLADAGWSDLGTEERVKAVMVRGAAAGAEPHSLDAFHAWLSAYRKRLDEVCDRPASARAGSRS